MNKADWKVLEKIEELAEKLPYRTIKIEINLKDGTELSFETEKKNPIGFLAEKEGEK